MNTTAPHPLPQLAEDILLFLHVEHATGATYTRDGIVAQFSAMSEHAAVQALDILIEAGFVRSPGGSAALVPIERRQHQAPLHDAHVREPEAHRAAKAAP